MQQILARPPRRPVIGGVGKFGSASPLHLHLHLHHLHHLHLHLHLHRSAQEPVLAQRANINRLSFAAAARLQLGDVALPVIGHAKEPVLT